MGKFDLHAVLLSGVTTDACVLWRVFGLRCNRFPTQFHPAQHTQMPLLRNWTNILAMAAGESTACIFVYVMNYIKFRNICVNRLVCVG